MLTGSVAFGDADNADGTLWSAWLFGAETEEAEPETVTGGWLPTREDYERIERHHRELREARNLGRRKKQKLENALAQTLRKAYLRSTGQEPETPQQVIANAPVRAAAPQPQKTAPAISPQPAIDWRALSRDVNLIRSMLNGMEMRFAEMREMEAAADEDDIEVLLLT